MKINVYTRFMRCNFKEEVFCCKHYYSLWALPMHNHTAASMIKHLNIHCVFQILAHSTHPRGVCNHATIFNTVTLPHGPWTGMRETTQADRQGGQHRVVDLSQYDGWCSWTLEFLIVSNPQALMSSLDSGTITFMSSRNYFWAFI